MNPSLSHRRRLLAGLLGVVALTGPLHADLPFASELSAITDNFDDDSLAPHWVERTGAAGVGFNTLSALQLNTLDGALSVIKINGQYDASLPGGGYPFTCGGLISQLGLGYGYYEISAKLPLQTGWHCSFWLGGRNEIDAPEIDTGPSSAGSPRTAHFNTHYWPATTTTSKVNHVGWGLDYLVANEANGRGETAPVDTSTGYHRYGFEWTPSQIFFYIDGVLKAKTRYPGPHHADNKAQISMLAYNLGGVGVQSPATMFVDYFKYYRRNYGFANWNTAGLNVALPLGDSTFAYSQNALDPDQLAPTPVNPRVIASNDFSATARWDFPASTAAASGRYEVFIWNPSTFSASSLSADISAAPQDSALNPGGMTVGYTVGGSTVVVDQVYAGQSWLGLGARAFAGVTTNAITLAVPVSSPANPLWSLRAGPAVFRPLARFDDFASGLLGAVWDPVFGTWGASGGYAANATAGESILLRLPSDVTVGDGLVRAQISLPPSGAATSAGLIARYATGSHYLLRFNYVSGKIGLLKYAGSAYVTIADATLPSDISLSVPVDVVFVLRNSGADVDLLGFVAGRPVIAATDYAPGAAYTGSGQAGVRAFGGTARFDDFGVGN